MSVSNEYLKSALNYCRVDDEEEEEIKGLTEAAIRKCEVETGKEFIEKDQLYALVVKMLVLDWYDHRGSVTTENIHALPVTMAAQTILDHIALSSLYKAKEFGGESDDG
jgi:uncharacterized phage protein (predicted DNA packaging)